MATSGTTDFTITGDEIIELALLDIGAIAIGESPSSDEYSDARKRFNLLLKSLQTKLAFITRRNEVTFSTVADTNGYAGVSGIDDIDDVWIEVNDTILPVDIYADKSRIGTEVTGLPEGVFIDQTTTPIYFYFYPVPNDVYEIHYRRTTVLESLVSGSDEVSLPVKWVDMLVKGLGYKLSPSYRLPLNDRMLLKAEYDELLKDVMKDNTYRNGTEIVAPLFVV